MGLNKSSEIGFGISPFQTLSRNKSIPNVSITKCVFSIWRRRILNRSNIFSIIILIIKMEIDIMLELFFRLIITI